MIDWTQPIETAETPPRPVRVLFDSDGGVYGVDIEMNLWSICSDKVSVCRRDDNGMGTHFITLRNVAPPKPEPALREAWVWWNSHGKATLSLNEEWCVHQRTVERGVYARAAAMSDGSPVEEDPLRYGVCETCVEKAVKSADEWRAKAEALQTEVERMKPVVDAAAAWASQDQLGRLSHIRKAVRTYQSQQAPDEPVKNCGTCLGASVTKCKWYSGVSVENCVVNGYDKWEPRHE